MAKVIKPKRSFTADSVPTTSDLEEGEVAINTADKIVYVRDDSDNIVKVGGAQSPLDEDLDTKEFEIKSTTSLNSNLGLPNAVKMGSYMKLAHKNTVASEFSIDADQCEVGKRYMISGVGNTDWIAMGAGANFGTTIFTCTATGTGTGTCLVGDDYFGTLAYDPNLHYVIVYNEYDSDVTSSTAMRFGWQKLSKGQWN